MSWEQGYSWGIEANHIRAAEAGASIMDACRRRGASGDNGGSYLPIGLAGKGTHTEIGFVAERTMRNRTIMAIPAGPLSPERRHPQPIIGTLLMVRDRQRDEGQAKTR